MANQSHLNKLDEGIDAWNTWRSQNPSVVPDLKGADLKDRAFGVNPIQLGDVFKGGERQDPINLEKADLSHSDLSGTDLRKARMCDANLTSAKLHGAILANADLRNATAISASLNATYDANHEVQTRPGANLTNATLSDAKLGKANLYEANLRESVLCGAFLPRTNLNEANLESSDLTGALLSYTELTGARLKNAKFTRAKIENAVFNGAYDITKTTGLETTIHSPGDLDFKFNDVNRPIWEKYLDWEKIGIVGKLPLFGFSYLALVSIPIFFFGLAFFNSRVEKALLWANNIQGTDPQHQLANLITQTLQPVPIPSLSLVFVVSTVVLALGSTIYALFCPSRIKQFTKDVWEHQLGHPIIHYWPISWKQRALRVTCVICYAIGGTGVGVVIISKVFSAAIFVWNNTEL